MILFTFIATAQHSTTLAGDTLIVLMLLEYVLQYTMNNMITITAPRRLRAMRWSLPLHPSARSLTI